MTKRERVLAAISGRPVDRLPYTLWHHFYLNPAAGEEMARQELQFYHTFDPDIFKVMHDIDYEMPEGLQKVSTPEDWDKLKVLDGKSGNFGEQLKTLKIIREKMGDDGILLDTIFSIHSTAEKVTGKRTHELLLLDPEAAHRGFKVIALSLANYATALIEAGMDGIYMAISGAASDSMSNDVYHRNYLQYDQQILAAAKDAAVNVVHHHGVGVYPDLVLSLKGWHAYSWSGQVKGNPGLREMRLKTEKCLMCGVDETTFEHKSPGEIAQEVKTAISDTNGIGLIIAPGCSVPMPPESSEAQMKAFRLGVEGS